MVHAIVIIFPIAIDMWTFLKLLWIFKYFEQFNKEPGLIFPISIPTPADSSISFLIVINLSNGGVKYNRIINSVIKQTDMPIV